jgi:hypothetical protein
MCTTRRRISVSFEANWETLARLASTQSKPFDLDACPTPSHPSISFETQPTNHCPLGFKARNQETVAIILGPNYQTIATDFEAQTKKLKAISFEAKSGETVATSFEAKPEKIVATGFEAKPEKTIPTILR